jgi:hypothetical protein
MNLIKDDAGGILVMGYCGPTPGGEAVVGLWIVANDTPSRVYPAAKYIYQRYSEERKP